MRTLPPALEKDCAFDSKFEMTWPSRESWPRTEKASVGLRPAKRAGEMADLVAAAGEIGNLDSSLDAAADAFGAIGQLSDYICMDGVIPLSKLPKALDEIGWICRKYRFDVANIFHAGDGNLHPLILYNANDPIQLERVELCGAEILKP